MKNKITIISPAYNRGYIIQNLYESLKIQTVKEFQWIIVDDGSTDNIQEIVEKILSENIVEVRYYKKENGGKHTALNYAIQLVDTPYCFIVDTDDRLPKNSIERILYWMEQAYNYDNIAGVGGLRKKLGTNEVIGTTFEGESQVCASFERSDYGMSGDKAEVFKTEILKQFPFPEFEGEKFLSESVVWNEIGGAGYKLLWFNEVIYEGEYLEDGLTNNLFTHYARSPKGFALYLKSLIQYENITVIKKYYYYGMYKNVVKTVTSKEVAQIFQVNIGAIKFGEILFKLIQFLKKR